MSFLLQPAAIFITGVIRLGPLRVSVYGLFASVGLLAALWLSQRTATLAGLEPQRLWDANLFGITAAFVISRVVLILGDPHSFRSYPLLMVTLPSFTYGDMALTALAVGAYLKWKRLRSIAVLDTWAPCAALVGTALSLGHFFEGADAGMPTRLPWGVAAPGSAGHSRLHPVQIYAALMSFVLLGVLMWLLQREERAGETTSVALLAGGALAYLLDMLTQPSESSGNTWLEPVQWIALGAIVAGSLLLTSLKERT